MVREDHSTKAITDPKDMSTDRITAITIIMVAVTVLMATITIAPLIQIAKAALAIMIITVMVASRGVRIRETTAGEIMETTVEVMTTVRTMVMRVAREANTIARIVQTRTITMSHNVR